MIPAPLRAPPTGIADAGYKARLDAFVCTCSGRRACHAEASRRRAACIATLVLAADTPKEFASSRAASTGEIVSLIYRCSLRAFVSDAGAVNWFLKRRRGLGFNQPFPAHVAAFAFHVERPRCATVFPDLRLPVIVVGRNCEEVRECGRDHDSAEHSNQKQPHHFSRHTSLICPS